MNAEALSSAAPGANPGIDDRAEFAAIFNALGESVVIIDTNIPSVLWFSAPCRLIHPVFENLQPSDRYPLELDCLLTDETSDTPPPAVVDLQSKDGEATKVTRYRVERVVLTEHRVAVRLSENDDTEAYFRRYIADREKLFSTSRTISVSEMATTLAHELNQPIGTVVNLLNGISSRLKASDSASDDVLKALDLANKQVQFASSIISRIRDFTRSRQPQITQCEVPLLVAEAIELLDWVFDSEKINVTQTMSSEPLIVQGDSTMLQQVIVNLCRNAVDAMRESPAASRKLDVSAYRSEDGVKIEIMDSGHGLSEESKDNLFVPFATSKPEGMGVGLNICRSFIELHQGRFWLAANATTGCTAHILFPDK